MRKSDDDLSEGGIEPVWLETPLKTESTSPQVADQTPRPVLAPGRVMMRRLLTAFVVLWGIATSAQPTEPLPAAQPPSAPAAPVSATVAPIAPAGVVPVTASTIAPVSTAPASLASPGFTSEDIVALVHADNPVERIKRADLAAMYLGQRKTWAHGPKVRVLRRALGSAPRDRVNRQVLEMSSATYRRHWQRKELAGRGIAPRSVGSAAQLLRMVRTERDAVGCLTGAEAVHLPSNAGVRAVRVEE